MNKPPFDSGVSGRIALVGLAAAIAVFFWKALTFTGVFFHFDLIGLNAPLRAFFFQNAVRGSFPLWCPELCCGFPLFAEGQLGPLYPPNFLLFGFLPPWAALNLSVLLHCAIAVLGAYLLFRNGHAPGPAAIGAMCYAFSSALLFHLVHLMLFQAACLLPWLFWFFDRALFKQRIADALGAALILGLMITTGQQQGSVYAALALAVYAITVAAEAWADRKRGDAVRVLGAGIMVGLLGAAMTLVISYGALELIHHSVRARPLDPDSLYSHSLLPELLVRLASPLQHGRWMNNTWLLPGRVEKELAVYLGLAAWILAPLAFAGGSGRRDRAHLAVVAFGFLFILGSAGPFAGLIDQVPVLNRMRIPTRFILPMMLSISFLVVSGLDRLVRDPPPIKRAIAFVALGTAAWAALAWGGAIHAYGRALFAGGHPTVASALGKDLILRSVLAVGLASAALLLVGNPFRKRVITAFTMPLIALMVFFDLWAVGRGENPVADPEVFGPFETVDFLQERLEGHRIYSTDTHVPYGRGGWAKDPKAFRYGIEGLPHSTPLLFGIPAASCGSSLVLARTREVYQSISITWLRQMSVKYVLSRRDLDLPVAMDTGRVRVYRLPEPAPLYGLAHEAICVADAREAFDSAAKPALDLARRAFVEGCDQEAMPENAGPLEAKVEVLESEADLRKLRVSASRDAFLVIRENFYPGWKAAVDGREAVLHRANYLFFGLVVPQGTREVTLAFDPDWFAPLLFFSLLCFGCTLGFALFAGAARPAAIQPRPDVPEDQKAATRVLLGIAICFLALLALAIARHPGL